MYCPKYGEVLDSRWETSFTNWSSFILIGERFPSLG